MGNCSSDEGKKPQGTAPTLQPAGGEGGGGGGGGGFGAPVKSAKENQEAQRVTGVPDTDLYNSLPPCEVAEVIRSIHPSHGGPANGVQLLETLYVSLKNLKDYARDDQAYRFVSLEALCGSEEAEKVASWAGFKRDSDNPSRLTAEESVGYFLLKRKGEEYQVALQYIEAMLGGVPELQPPPAGGDFYVPQEQQPAGEVADER